MLVTIANMTEITYRGKPVKKIEILGQGSTEQMVYLNLVMEDGSNTMLFELRDMHVPDVYHVHQLPWDNQSERK